MSKINWQKELQLNEDQVDDMRNTGYAYVRQGKYEIALPIFEALCILAPKSTYDAQTLGAIYLQIGQTEKALKYLEHALELEPQHGPTLLNLAKAFFTLQKIQEGLKVAHLIKNSKDKHVASIANALILAYS